MPGTQPQIVRLFRIVHINNVDYLLRHGMYIKSHQLADPNYINIGDSGLIQQRNDYPVGIAPPNGTLGDYVPFYFGPLSPMLLNIKTGHRGIIKRPQEDIVYICCRLETVVANGSEWCFTNGHAQDKLTDFFNNEAQLNEVFWDVVSERYWSPTEEFPEKQVRKQAEFLVKTHVPVECISGIVVFNEQKRILVQNLVAGLGLQIVVVVNPKNLFYY
jgi:hypothetical protein